MVGWDSVTHDRIVTWSEKAVHLPFAARCGAALIAPDWMGSPEKVTRDIPGIAGIVGGQLSYNDTSCVAPPVSLNEAWYARELALNNSAIWHRGPNAPFSPRRSQQYDPSYIQQRVLVGSESLNWYLPSATLIGGMRILHHRAVNSTHPSSASRPHAVLTSVELYADVWECKFSKTSCVWGNESFPADSVPLPTAGGSALLAHSGVGGALIGGMTSMAAITTYRSTYPKLDLEGVGCHPRQLSLSMPQISTNLSVISSARLGGRALDMDELMAARQQLPLSALLTEAELNGNSPYTLGSDWVQSRYQYDGWMSWNLPYATTVHHQPFAYADTPEQSTMWVRQAASSLNTSRPLLNFPLSRLGHTTWVESQWQHFGFSLIVGGRSGEVYFNDLIQLVVQRCLPVMDPLYYATLGPVAWETSGVFIRLGSSVQARCVDGYHWEPPSLDLTRTTTLTCAPNGVWMNFDLRTVQSCKPDILNCSYPYVDLGFDQCLVPTAEVTGVELGQIAKNVDNVTIIDAPVDGQETLIIYGSHFSAPVNVLVGGYECTAVELWQTAADVTSGIEVCDASAASDSATCEPFVEQVRCVMPKVHGVYMPVHVTSGFCSRPADVVGSSSNVVTITSIAPIIMQTFPKISTGRDLCNVTDDSNDFPTNLIDCPIQRPFDILVLMWAPSVMDPRLVVQLDGERLNCTKPGNFYGHPFVNCTIIPRPGTTLPLTVQHAAFPVASKPSLVSFRTCRAGTHINAAAVRDNFCLPCAAGSSSGANQNQCEVCHPGHYANRPGMAACEMCPAGYFMPDANATQCVDCPLNSYSTNPGSTTCTACPATMYIRYDDVRDQSSNMSRARGRCVFCPEGADCTNNFNSTVNNFNISALTGYFLLIDQNSSTVSAVACSSSACVQDNACPTTATPPAPLITRSQLPVINCCTAGRYPAYDPYNLDLSATNGMNVLCATCLPGHALVNDRCIPCAAVHWGPLTAKLLLALLLVFALHRLPHDWSGSASITIGSYFLQVSLLFLGSEALPPVLTLINLSLVGDHHSRGVDRSGSSGGAFYAGACTVPLSDYGRIAQSLLSPIIAYLLLAVVLVAQLLYRTSLNNDMSPSTANVRSINEANEPFIDNHNSGSGRRGAVASKVYHLLFTPSAVKMPDQQSPSVAMVPPSQHRSSPLLLADNPIDGLDPINDSRTPQHFLHPSLVATLATHDHLSSILLWYQRTAVRLLMLSYIPMAVVALSYFNTVSVGAYGLRLVDYPTINTASPQYTRLILVMGLVIAVTVCGLPLGMLALLAYEHRRGTIARLPEVVVASRCDNGYSDVLSWRKAGPPLLDRMRSALVMQLCAMYRPRYWWYPVFILVRRLIVVALLVFIVDQSVWIWLTLVNTLLLTVHVVTRPYAKPVCNTVETLTLLSLVMQTTLLSRWPPPFMSHWLLSALLTLVMAPMLYLFMAVTMKRWTQCQRSTYAATATSATAGLARSQLGPASLQPDSSKPHAASVAADFSCISLVSGI